MNVLIVEDNAQMRLLIRDLVSDLASEVWELDDGAGACAAYAEHRPDWVLMDLRMQQVDGFEATRQITERFPDARVVIVTECRDDEMREQARVAGARAYVVKDDLMELRLCLLVWQVCTNHCINLFW